MTEFYKKYRPRTLDRVVGSLKTVSALKNMLERKTLPHTILLHGPSGCGKTTIARILRNELNCDEMDFTEMNCSDFRGIDTIRDIARVMNLAPIRECRIWLLDEVHQLSKDGQNAALKMMEDTPSHVYFFLCTTDPQKILKTIKTRCCEMAVESLKYEELAFIVDRVCKKENLTITEEVKDELVSSAQGSARTVLVLLDKISNLKPEEQKEAIVSKLAEENEAIDLCRALIKKEPWKKIAGILKNLKGDPEGVRYAVLGYARALLLNTADIQAYIVIDCFQNNFYDSKEAGLAHACYSAINAK